MHEGLELKIHFQCMFRYISPASQNSHTVKWIMHHVPVSVWSLVMGMQPLNPLNPQHGLPRLLLGLSNDELSQARLQTKLRWGCTLECSATLCAKLYIHLTGSHFLHHTQQTRLYSCYGPATAIGARPPGANTRLWCSEHGDDHSQPGLYDPSSAGKLCQY